MRIALFLFLVSTVTAAPPPFTIKVTGDTATLRYPDDRKIDLIEVCLGATGYYPDNPMADDWHSIGCWAPRFSMEQRNLARGTYEIQGHLSISEDSRRSVLHSDVVTVRARPERTHGR